MLRQQRRLAPAGGGGKRLNVVDLGLGLGIDDGDAWGEGDALGPPPDCGPVLVRQQATDWTAAREAKAKALANKVDAAGGSRPGGDRDALRATRRIILSSGGGNGGGGGRQLAGECL